MEKKIIWTIIYTGLVALIVWLEHHRYAQRWRRRELARRTMGIGTVLGLAVILPIAGVFDWTSYIIMWIGFGVAGAVTAYHYTQKEANIDAKTEAIRDGGHGLSGEQDARDV